MEVALENLAHEIHETAHDPELLWFTRLSARVELNVLLCHFYRITGRNGFMPLKPDLTVGVHAKRM